MSSFFDITASDKPVLVDFFADWCGPCKAMSPILKEVKESMGDKIKLLKVDVEKNQRLATALNVQGVPTLVLYKNSQILWRQSGMIPKRDIVSKINEYL
ncbi:MAG: thioredoxin [Bacteroidetes bacterium]|nr:thioredoxin [Bacteroidota bacterium]